MKRLQTTLAKAKEGSKVRMLGVDRDLTWHQDAGGLVIEMPERASEQSEAAVPPGLRYLKVESNLGARRPPAARGTAAPLFHEKTSTNDAMKANRRLGTP